MPFVKVSSNAKRASVDVDAVLKAVSKGLSDALDRPEEYMMAEVELDRDMLFAGTTEPCAFVVIRSIGQVDEERNPKTVAALTQIVSTHLGVPTERVFINLDLVARGNWGIYGQIFV